MLLLDFHCKENYRTIWFLGHTRTPRTCWTRQTPDFMNTIITVDESWVYRYDMETKFSLQWKSGKSTKHNLIQMLLAINWCYWQMGKNSSMHMEVKGRFMQVSLIEIHQVFIKKNSGTDTFLFSSLPLQLMKAAVLAESYTFYPLSSRSTDSSNVYWQ